MAYLLIVSIVWGFSFGLIKGNLTGLSPYLVSFIRIFLSFLIFLPFIKFNKIKNKVLFIKLFFIGMFQFGLMYIVYIYAFKYLKAYEIALFTILTPIYVTIINDLHNKLINKKAMLSAVLAIIGALFISYTKIESNNLILGFMFVQISNLCFALGQVEYKRVMNNSNLKDIDSFGILYLGALIITLIFSINDLSTITLLTKKQILTLLYLGTIASGICFFLWNKGVRLTNIATVAVFNNLKIPLAIFISLIFFKESTDLLKLFIGSFIILLALFINNKKARI